MTARDGADLHHPPDPQHVPIRVAHYWEETGKDPRPVYTAPTEAAAAERFEEFDAK